jgi:hypothetical protein
MPRAILSMRAAMALSAIISFRKNKKAGANPLSTSHASQQTIILYGFDQIGKQKRLSAGGGERHFKYSL